MRRMMWTPPLFVLVGAVGYLWWRGEAETAKQENRPEPAAFESSKEPLAKARDVPTPPLSLVAPPEVEDAIAPAVAAESLEDDDFDEDPDPVQEARRIRLPVILAIRGKHPTPEARRTAMLEALAGSGESADDWTRNASVVFDSWDRALTSEVERNVDLRNVRCFQAGCEVPVVFPDRGSFERAAAEFRRIHDEGTLHGGRVQTPAVERDDGSVEASWLMLRPDGVQS